MSETIEETENCIVCHKDSKGQIAHGHVRTESGVEVVATFCSKECSDAAGGAGKDGYRGPYRAWMGSVPWRAGFAR
jgi:hypothetical protein